MAKIKRNKIIQVPIEEELLKRIDATAGIVARAAQHSFVRPVIQPPGVTLRARAVTDHHNPASCLTRRYCFFRLPSGGNGS
jgi:hypothetical protein